MTLFNLSCRKAGLPEGLFLSLDLDGERRIGQAQVRQEIVHEGFEAMALGRDLFQVLALAERICGSCSLSNALAFVRAVEEIGGIAVPRRASYLRSLFLELERMASHFLWLASTLRLGGQRSLMMAALSLRERTLDLLETLSGKRSNWAIATFGGVRCDLDGVGLAAAEAMIALCRRELPPFLEALSNDALLRARMEGIGFLSRERALSLGAVGPVARGSGLAVDLRWSSPYEAYGELRGEPILGGLNGPSPGGDVFHRFLLRLREIDQSLGLVEALIGGLPVGPVRGHKNRRRLDALLRKAEGTAHSLVEGPRGEICHGLVLHRGERGLVSWQIRSATCTNALLWPLLLEGELLDDGALIVSSTDPCMAWMERPSGAEEPSPEGERGTISAGEER